MQSESFFADPAGEFGRLTSSSSCSPGVRAFEQHNARPSTSMPRQARQFLIEHFREQMTPSRS